MKSESKIIASGGWETSEVIGKPRTRLFSMLAAIWFGVFICALIPFWGGWPTSFGWEDLLCGALLLPQPIFAVLALFYLLTEQPRAMIEKRPNADYDLRNLY